MKIDPVIGGRLLNLIHTNFRIEMFKTAITVYLNIIFQH